MVSTPTRKAPDFISGMVQVLADPVSFARTCLRADPWSISEQIMRSVAQNPRTAVKACHASAKTWTAARIALWWLASRPGTGIVISTAPTWTQVEKLLWGEIHSAVAKSLWPFPPPNKTELRIGPDNYAFGLSTDESDRFQGFHGDVLIIIDEAPGVRPGIFSAIEGIRAGGDVRILMLGNPVVAAGAFYEAFKNSGYAHITIDAFDTPNFEHLPGDTANEKAAWLEGLPSDWGELSPEEQGILSYRPRPYLIDPRWVWESGNEWGFKSGIYLSRARGRFPEEGANQLYPLSFVEAARLKVAVPGDLPLEAGIDVGGAGKDESVLYIRGGQSVLEMKSWRLADPRGAMAAALLPYKERGIEIKCDGVGIGYHVYTHLKSEGFRCRPFISQRRSSEPKRFANLRAQIGWEFREKLERGEVAGLTDKTTAEQLLGIQYFHTPKGQIILGEKRLKGAKSPDRAEALVASHATGIARPLKCY